MDKDIKATDAARTKKKKAVIIAIIAMLVFMLAALTALNYIDFDALMQRDNKNNNNYKFYEPDYEANIFENEEYLQKNRAIEYTEGAVSTIITEDEYSQYGGALLMLADYIDSIIKGDAQAYAAFFSDSFKSKVALPDRFAMQKLYNINITKLSKTDKTDNNGEYTEYVYRVSYMIMKNDGTFRSDMGSDAARPQELTIIYREDVYKITGVATYSYQ